MESQSLLWFGLSCKAGLQKARGRGSPDSKPAETEGRNRGSASVFASGRGSFPKVTGAGPGGERLRALAVLQMAGKGWEGTVSFACRVFLSLKIKSGKSTKQMGKVPPSAGARCGGTPVCLFSGFRKHVVCHWPNDQPFLCFPSLALQDLWSHIASLLCIYRISQVASGSCRDGAGVELPPSVAHPPTPALQRRAGKAKLCRSCSRLC